MSKNYKANPVNAPLITKPGESTEYVGTRNVTGLLPEIFQTQVNKRFLDSTLEQLMSSGSLQAIDHYVGERGFKTDPKDSYVEDGRTSDPYQFVPGLINKDENGNVTNALAYDDLLHNMRFSDVQLNQNSRVFDEAGYTLDLPINIDMFTNYHRYFWALDTVPVCNIVPTVNNPITLDDIVGKFEYTTPTLANGKTLTLKNGMRIRFESIDIERQHQTVAGNRVFTSPISDPTESNVYLNNTLQTAGVDYNKINATDYEFVTAPAVGDEIEIHCFWTNSGTYKKEEILIVDGVGRPEGISFTKQFVPVNTVDNYGTRVWFNETIYSGKQPTKFDQDGESFEFKPFDLRELKIKAREYTVEERTSLDQSAWARSNLWLHQDTIEAICAFTGDDSNDYTVEELRATRPIIEYHANIKKYDYGTKHLTFIDYMFDQIDPVADIIGRPQFDLARHLITGEWRHTGYNKGDLVKRTISGEITYWDCRETHGEPHDPTEYSNRRYWNQVYSKVIEDGELILFINSSNPGYNNNIYRVSGNGTSLHLTPVFTQSDFEVGHKVTCVNGYNAVFYDSYDGHVYSGSEWYWTSGAWRYGQQKEHSSAGALFQLYDLDLVELQNADKYPNSTFAGDRIFDFGKGSGPVDASLGFAPRYVDYGNTPGLSFDLELGAKRYEYNVIKENSNYHQTFDTNNISEIPGYYFYRTLDTDQYFNGWKLIRGGQPVKRHSKKTAVDSSTPVVFNLGTTDINTDNKYVIRKNKDGFTVSSESTLNTRTHVREISGVNPKLFVSKDKTYYIQTLFPVNNLSFTDFDGNALVGVTVTTVDTYNATITVGSAFNKRVIRYSSATNSAITGLIYVDTNTNHRNLEVYINGKPSSYYTLSGSTLTITHDYVAGDEIDVYWHSDSELDTEADGNYLPADTHLYNPFNEWATEVSFGDLQEHLRAQMTGIPGFTGDYFGLNNYKDLPFAHDFGGTIRKQPYSAALLAQLSSDVDTNVYNSLRYAAENYKKFKAQFLRKVEQLHNTMAINVPVHELVDRALSTVNLGKDQSSAYANSDMALFKNFESVDYTVETGQPVVFDLPHTVNTYGDTANHVQVWLNDQNGWHALIKDVDYSQSETKITVNKTIAYKTSDNSATVHIRWYPIKSVSFVPPSAVKLGLIKSTLPRLTNYDTESTNTSNTSVIVGHDGSITTRQGTNINDRSVVGFSITDAALWDLELRIYNNLNSIHDSTSDYKEIMPNANRSTAYDWHDFVSALEPDFKRFVIQSGLNTVTDPTYYDANNSFTWNYGSVGPGIGGWRALYRYYFNTDRPHTHPWEMFGYNKKPTWWDKHYSWTTASKRSNLINALKTGHYNDPDVLPLFNRNYAYTAYDWDTKTLVTHQGALQSPADAAVVPTPGVAERAAEFKFGDMSSIEFEWIKTSEYKILQTLALLRLRPLWVTNTFFDSANISIVRNNRIPDDIIVNKDLRQLGNYRNTVLSNTAYSDSIVERVEVKSSSTVSGVPTVEVFGNYGSDAAVKAIVENNQVIAVSVTDPGHDYQSKPGLVFSNGNIVFDTYLTQGARRYAIGMSTAVVDFAHYNNTSAEQLQQRFAHSSVQPIIKTGGFVNPNRQSVVLESSQDKGRVVVPEENTQTVLYMNQPNHDTFMGGIQLTKLSNNSYRVVGIDRNNLNLKYLKPKTNSKKIYVTIENFSLERYTNYSLVPSTLHYGDTVENLQAAYSLLLGHGEFLKSEGWITNWKKTADQFAAWSATANAGDTYICIPKTTRYEIKDSNRGYYDTIVNRYDGVSNIVDQDGNAIAPNRLVVSRPVNSTEENITTVEVKDAETHILGLRLYRVELEHVIVVNNETDFDDVIYNPVIGQRHRRAIWKGSRTKNWNGKLYAPGYLVTDNTIIDNFDTVANSSLDYFTTDSSTVNNQQMTDAARFNVGYNTPQWSEYLNTNSDTAFDFVKGSRKYRGTKYGLNAFMRNTSILGGVADANLYEMWAIRTADYGDIRSRDTVEFELDAGMLKTDPQVVQFHADDFIDISVDDTINIDPSSNLLVTGSTKEVFRTRNPKKFNTQNLADMDQFENDFVTAGLPLLTETDYRILNKEDFEQFPEETRSAYNFSGEWRELEYWNNRRAYKFNDMVLHEGYVWRMCDPDGSSELQRPNDPIEVVGRVTLPIIPQTGQTLEIDGTVVTIKRTSESTTLNTIELRGSQSINTAGGVPHGSTLILGQSSTINQTVTFDNEVSQIVFQDVTKTGTVTNFFIDGGPNTGKQLIIDNVTINFDGTSTSTNVVTVEDAFETAFNATFIANLSSVSSVVADRIAAIENLRLGIINNSGLSAWNTFVSNYFTNVAGLDLQYASSVQGTGVGTGVTAEIDALIDNDIDIINAITNNTYTTPSGVLNSDVTTSQSALAAIPFITNIKNFITNNPTTAFTASEVVATTTGTGNKRYSDVEIVQEINAANIPNVTAGLTAAGNLTITKTTNDPSQPFSLTISAASANSDVGFASATQTLRSSGVTIISTPSLTLAEAVIQINAAGIPNITAVALATGQLQINSSAATLFVGAGSANNAIGLNEGVTPATVTVTSTDRTSDLTDTVSSINDANIPGITASNSNNRLKIVSTNDTMTIGSVGTANGTLGITAQVYYATQSIINNVFNEIGSNGQPEFCKVDVDPHTISMWVADNSEKTNVNAGYNVYQAMNFGMYITKSCAGIVDADEAQIVIDLADYPDEYTPFHNLNVGDYVLINGSNCVPNIDGVHQVTRVDPDFPNIFYIDEFIQENGTVGNVYPLRSVRFSSYADLIANYNTFKVHPTVPGNPAIYRYNFGDLRHNGDPVYAFVDDDNGAPAVYEFTGSFSLTGGNYDGIWKQVRLAEGQSRSDLVENVKIYDANRRTLITALEIYDPAKGVVPAFVDTEIEFKSTADMAVYNYDSYNGYEDSDDIWTDQWIGKRWWNLATSVYLDYEQGSSEYQQQQWGRLFPGAEIEIYEWTRSPVLPEDYANFVRRGGVIDGKSATGEPYSIVLNGEIVYYWTEKQYYNPVNNRTETNYYYWVKNKTSASGIRNYTVYQLANIITNFKDLNIAWAAPSLNDTLLLANVEPYVSQDAVVQINQIYESNSLPLNEWTLIAENDPDSVISEYLHIKIRDSLAGYNNYRDLYTYTEWDATAVYNREDVVVKNDEFFICLDNSVTGTDPATDTVELHWAKIYKYILPPETEATDIEVWRGQPVPDLRLHPFNRYGHLTRPVQSLYRDITTARQNFVDAANEYLEDLCVVSEITNWDSAFYTKYTEGTVEYDLQHYWNFADWHYKEYGPNGELTYKHDSSIEPDYTFDRLDQIINKTPIVNSVADVPDGSYVLIKNSKHEDGVNRPEMWYKQNGTYSLRWKKFGTIQLSDELWLESKFGHGFDAAGFDISGFDSGVANMINLLFDLFRDEIFVGQHRDKYNKLWFRCLYQAVIDNTADDFAFKTTYVKINVDHPLIRDPKRYQNYGTTAIEKYFADIKPFHTKLHTLSQRPSTMDQAILQLSDNHESEITLQFNDYTRKWCGDTVLLGGDFTTEFDPVDPYNDADYVTSDYSVANINYQFVTGSVNPYTDPSYVAAGYSSDDIEVIYDGNTFIQPQYECIGQELVGLDVLENLRIRVQTNASGSTETADTRSFQIHMFTPYDIQESIAIVDSRKTTITQDVAIDDTDITVADASNMQSSGVIWINNERIEYRAIENNTLKYCIRGTLATTIEAYTSGATVIDAGSDLQIPTEQKFAYYGNNLGFAYNDSGTSLSAAGTGANHKFIRNAGAGTI